MYGVYQIVCLKLRISHAVTNADGAEHAPARGDDLPAFAAGAAMKYFPGKGCCGLETADRITLAESIRIAARGHDHAECRARVPSNLVSLQGAGKRGLA